MFTAKLSTEKRYSKRKGMCEALKNHREEKMGKTSKLGQDESESASEHLSAGNNSGFEISTKQKHVVPV